MRRRASAWMGWMAIASLATLWACTGTQGPAGGHEVRSSKARVMAPSVSQAEERELALGNTAFAADLYRLLRDEGENVFFSPLSVSLALAMTDAGARGETERQLAATLHFTLPQERLHPAMNALDLALASRAQGGGQGADGKGFRLRVVNALWGQQGYGFLPAFLDTLALNYGAGLRVLDFMRDPEAARKTINDWVEYQTEQRIKDLLPQGSISDLTRLVLTNAIYFNAAWATPFAPGNTQNGLFFPRAGSPVTVPLMTQTDSFGYAEGEGFQAVELPYEGRKLSMVVLLPAEGQLEAFEQGLTGEKLAALLGSLGSQEVRLTMPRFRFDFGLSLKETLETLGMGVAFDAQHADFTGMTGTNDLYIGDVIHKAFVAVDEKGTEAAAATAVIMVGRGAPVEVKTVTLNRPFLFLIRDLETAAVLFLGRVANPAG